MRDFRCSIYFVLLRRSLLGPPMSCSTPLTSWTLCLGAGWHLEISLHHPGMLFFGCRIIHSLFSLFSSFSDFPFSFVECLQIPSWEWCMGGMVLCFVFCFLFFFLFVTMRLPKCLCSIPVFCMMFYLDGLVWLGILSRQEFEDTALCLSSVPWCSWELWCHPDSQTFENNMFWSL